MDNFYSKINILNTCIFQIKTVAIGQDKLDELRHEPHNSLY